MYIIITTHIIYIEMLSGGQPLPILPECHHFVYTTVNVGGQKDTVVFVVNFVSCSVLSFPVLCLCILMFLQELLVCHNKCSELESKIELGN